MTGQTWDTPPGGFKELDLTTVERIEQYIAFEGRVELLRWEETSQWGFKIKLGLTARVCLDWFDNTMKRSKTRGGQRYHCIFTNTGDNEDRQLEAMFCGRGWAETQGAHIALHIPDPSDAEWWKLQTANDQREKEERGAVWDLLLLEIGDDEIIINQKYRKKAEEPLKGGPHSKAVAMLLQDQDFQWWLIGPCLWTKGGDLDLSTFDGRDELVKRVCKIKSKVEFDHDEQAWERWNTQFHRPFIQYMKSH